VRSERNVGEAILNRSTNLDIHVGSIQYPSILNGYIFVECDDREGLNRIIKTIRNAQGLLNGETTKAEISEYIDTPRSKKILMEGVKIEILDGQFKGQNAIVKHINERTKEVTVELTDEIFKIPIVIRKKECKVVS
jgi:transcription elongation factor Spt5